MERLAALCTGPRVTLLAVLAALYTLFLIEWAETPMATAQQIAIAQHKENPARPLPPNCSAAAFTPEGPILAFDGALRGYGYDAAMTVLCAMEANARKGKDLYLHRHFPADMVYPVLYGPALAGLYLFLLWSFGTRSHRLKYLALVPVAAAALDLVENLVVRSLVVAGPPPDETVVTVAAILTVSKGVLLLSSAIVTLGLLLWYLGRESVRRT